MIQAYLHNKHRNCPDDWRRSEDLLTSTVFGELKNLSEEATVQALKGATPMEGLSGPSLQPPLQWSFWPWWDAKIPRVKGCEPDVVISDNENVCVVEAKLFSDFGPDLGAGTQLDREWTQGLHLCQSAKKQLWLLAVTNHVAFPHQAISRQLENVPELNLTHVLWTSWRALGRRIVDNSLKGPERSYSDVLEVMTRVGVAPFEGFAQTLKKANSWVEEGAATWRFPEPLALPTR